MSYTPSAVPQSFAQGLRAWLARELRIIANAIDTVDNLSLVPLAAEPTRLADGMIVYANGTDWNPGSGAGVYARESGAWVKL